MAGIRSGLIAGGLIAAFGIGGVLLIAKARASAQADAESSRRALNARADLDKQIADASQELADEQKAIDKRNAATAAAKVAKEARVAELAKKMRYTRLSAFDGQCQGHGYPSEATKVEGGLFAENADVAGSRGCIALYENVEAMGIFCCPPKRP